jgi:hypothetical protein
MSKNESFAFTRGQSHRIEYLWSALLLNRFPFIALGKNEVGSENYYGIHDSGKEGKLLS